jgi:hypothetical protein
MVSNTQSQVVFCTTGSGAMQFPPEHGCIKPIPARDASGWHNQQRSAVKVVKSNNHSRARNKGGQHACQLTLVLQHAALAQRCP